MSTHGIGAVVTLTTEVRNSADVLVDPAAVSLTILLPDGTTVGPFISPAVVRDSVGAYYYDFATTAAGRHIARWVSTTPTGVDEESFDVAAMWSEAGVISLSGAKKQLNIDADDHDADEEISGFARSVTEVCERHVGALGRRSYTEKHSGGYQIALNHTPVLLLTSAVAVRTGGLGLDVADLDVDGPTGIVERLDACYMAGPIRFTYVAGRTDIPPHVDLAAKILLQHLWDTQRGQSGGVRVGGSDEVYDPRFGFAIPRRVLELLGDQVSGIA
ncbi:hypothetical protein AB0B89_27190 [Sphaerisporangium sp. NPDC049002]|uniref:hypothetical protein n=1 Tax=Sphaerisporangium sp. NPDC049002 TaxID=3155392 RepID=UPI0033E8CC68